MAERKKRAGWADGGGQFRDLLDEIIGSGAQRVFETVHRVTPKCQFCGTSTIMRCQACGKNVCNIHGFVNAKAWNRYTVVCSECMGAYFPFVEIEPPPNYASPDEMPWQHDEEPWAILGISWDADESAIGKAFKAKAREVHPDHASDEVDRARRDRAMKRVTAAYEWMTQRLGRQ